METAADQIATQLASIMREYYGHGPVGARAFMHEDCVVVVMEETFSLAEQTLIERGDAEEIQRIRRRFQSARADDFKEIVERHTGREVDTFVSDTDVVSRVAVEVFLLGKAKTDMDAFEDADTRADEERSNLPDS